MIYLHYKDTKTFGHSFSFLLIFKTLRASYLQVGNFSQLTAKSQVGVDYRGKNTVKSVQNEKYSAKSADFLRFLLYLYHVIDDFACLDLQH